MTVANADSKVIGSQGQVDILKLQAQAKEDDRLINTQGDVDINKIGATGDEQRKTMQEQTRQTAKDRTNQRSFSRELAAR